jgi:hypothetical protein
VGALAEAAGHPREVADQARDLLGRVRTSPELRALADRVAGDRAGRTLREGGRDRASRRATGATARLRSAASTARLASTVVGQAHPDPERHRLLIPFAPERLRATWLATAWSLWAALAAGAVALVSAAALLLRAL